jgi:hypothetical protein
VKSRQGSQKYDYVITAVYADEVAQVVQQGLPALLPPILARFRYINSISIAHDYEPAMPPEKTEWETFNIRIFQPGARMLRPYIINYVELKHQGQPDPKDSWFVSLDPVVPIPTDRIRPMLDLDGGQPARAAVYFRHNLVTTDSLMAQRLLHQYQGKDAGLRKRDAPHGDGERDTRNNLFYTGGWTNGAGLHEETLATSINIAQIIRGFTGVMHHTYSRDDPKHVPEYIRNSFETAPKQVVPRGFWR